MNFIKNDDIVNLILYNKAINDLLYFQNIKILTNINIFINISNNSNAISNFIKEINNYINKNIKIYLYDKKSIEIFLSIETKEENIIKIINILGHIKLS